MDSKVPRAPLKRRSADRAAPDPRRRAEGDQNTNEAVAASLREYADLLAHQEADGFRTMAYRRAADILAALDRPVDKILAKDGREGLMALPGIGPSIAGAVAEMLTTGRWSQLERLRGELEPEKLFQTLPGVGPELAARLHERLEAESLEALEVAAHDGRLERVPGIGRRRAELIRGLLAERLGRPRLRRIAARRERPPVELLLSVDREYREKAAAGRLRRIAPKRFNPTGEAWLPVLHTRRGEWEFTALFSNTRLAHELGRTGDWVVIYYHTGATPEGQCTVVTETRGTLAGRRVVRGREQECQSLESDG
ncbi:MAG TPA: helix-hairpin-helix domain-containing protein [Gammaproteobacteria bacterium]|nr:helix-hairpin-helix domain-containing protein [Gammaproteobacteria bacterium]